MNLPPRLLTCLALVTLNANGASAPDAESVGVTVHVASNGVDAFPCGGALSPCRWGAASGPGADPADNVCNDEGDDVTVTSPVSRRPISVPRMISGKFE